MIRLMVVDDQPVARRGIRRSIDWEQYGIRIVAEAWNGQEAIESIEKSKPQIVLTDIRMPVMDGLELATHIRSHHPGIEVIIVSGYDDFRYAQQAVRAGVSDYLLKPVGADELVATVSRVCDRIRSVYAKNQTRRDFDELYRENRLLLRGRLMTGVVDGSIEPNQMIGLMESMDATLSGPFFQALALHATPLRQANARYPHSLPASRVVSLTTDIEAAFEPPAVAFTTSDRPGRVELVVSRRRDGPRTELEGQLQRFIAESERQGLRITVGIGPVVGEVREIGNSLRQAIGVLDSIPCGDSRRSFHVDSTDRPAFADMGEVRRALQLSEIEQAFVEAIVEYDDDRINDVARSLSRRVRDGGIGLEHVRRAYVGVVMGAISRFEDRLDTAIQSVGHEELLVQSALLGDCDQFDAWLRGWVKAIFESHRADSLSKMTPLSRDAIRLARAAGGKNVSLRALASKLSVTPNHLGHVFRRDAGERFTDWLNSYRVERAKRLLTETSMRVYEVAIEVGISDAGYFQELFKRYSGVNPTEYRTRRGG